MEYDDEFIDSFVCDFSKMSVRSLMKKYDLSQNDYKKLKTKLGLGTKKKVFEGLNSIFSMDPSVKHYSLRKDGRYCISKGKNGKSIFYTSCATEELAKKTVELLIKYDWDKSKIPQIKEDLEYKKVEFEIKYKNFDFEGFKKDYDVMLLDDILEKYDLKFNEYLKIRKYLGLKRKKKGKKYKK